jgi:hypothetical protein
MVEFGKAGDVQGREEILAGDDAGYEPFIKQCYEISSESITKYRVAIRGGERNRIACEVLVDIFFTCKADPNFLEGITAKIELEDELHKRIKRLRLRERDQARKDKKRSKGNLSVEEADELGLLGYASLDGSPCDGHDNSDDNLDASELIQAVLVELRKLPDKRRVAIEMAAEKTPHKEIAAKLNMNTKAVGQELRRGRAVILKALPAKYLKMLNTLFRKRRVAKR